VDNLFCFLGDTNEELGCFPLTSTPTKSVSGKHPLHGSPNAIEPNTKRLNDQLSPGESNLQGLKLNIVSLKQRRITKSKVKVDKCNLIFKNLLPVYE
jgi:hypothetical protein